jgi:hypothetical protein
MRGLGLLEVKEHNIQVGGHSHAVVDVHLSEEALKIALEHAAEVVKGSKGFITEDGLDSEGRYVGEGYTKANCKIGGQGQGAVSYYLNGDVEEGLTQMVIGMPDDGKDVVYCGRRLQVKTFDWIPAYKGDKLPVSWMLVHDDEFKRAEGIVDFYISCQRIALDWIRILGFISYKAFKRLSVPAGLKFDPDDLSIERLKDLTPIKCLDSELRPSVYELIEDATNPEEGWDAGAK